MMKKYVMFFLPTKQRLLFVLLVAVPLVAISTLIRLYFISHDLTLENYFENTGINFLMIYPLALIFVPVAQFCISTIERKKP